jgi:TolB-like protein
MLPMGSLTFHLLTRTRARERNGELVVAWLVIQISATVMPVYHAPEWILPIFITAVALGLPVALVLAWAFELKGGVIGKTPESGGGLSATNKRRAWLLAGAGLTISAFAVGGYWLWYPSRKATTASQSSTAAMPVVREKSIAVLSFENLSEDKANAYFADGIQEEILTRLAKIADLKVISRTSTQRFQSKPGNLAEIAKQLGVANILEGSVQKAGNQVRVNVQLVNAQSDSHLWADTYDRKLVDIFVVESEIAKAIAESLQAKLTGSEQRALAVKPTNNSEAYDAYLRGLAFQTRTTSSLNDQAKVVGFYERSVQLDPAFALGWARLSRANAQIYFGSLDSTAARRDAAERALDTAQKLQPNSPETLLAQAYYQYWVLRDYDLAKTTFGRVRDLLPGSSDVPGALALITRRQGRWDESVAYWEQTLALDPRNTEWLATAAETYAMLRQFPAALKTYDRLLDLVPNDPDTLAYEARICQAQGNLEQAGKLLVGVNAQIYINSKRWMDYSPACTNHRRVTWIYSAHFSRLNKFARSTRKRSRENISGTSSAILTSFCSTSLFAKP